MVGESQEAVGAGVGGGSSGSNKMPTLEEYGTNLTTQAEEVGACRCPQVPCFVVALSYKLCVRSGAVVPVDSTRVPSLMAISIYIPSGCLAAAASRCRVAARDAEL